MYVALLTKGTVRATSARSNGDWAAFMACSKDGAIKRALAANDKWGGGYTVLVGRLTELAKPRRDYYLSSL